MNPQDPNQMPQKPQSTYGRNNSNQPVTATESPSSGKPLKLESSDTGPRTWVPRWTNEMLSGIGVMAAAILALLGSLVGYLPISSGQVPVAAAIILSSVCLPLSAYFWFIAIRRMRWEHRNGGILRRSLSGGGILVAIFVAIIGLLLLVSS